MKEEEEDKEERGCLDMYKQRCNCRARKTNTGVATHHKFSFFCSSKSVILLLVSSGRSFWCWSPVEGCTGAGLQGRIILVLLSSGGSYWCWSLVQTLFCCWSPMEGRTAAGHH